MKTIKTTFVYDEKNMSEFFYFHLKRKDKMRWIYYGISLIFLIIGIILSFIFKQYKFGLLIIASSIIMFLLFPYQAKRAAKKTASSRYKRIPQDIVLSSERIEQHVENKVYVYKWNLVKEVDETNKYIYFYISKVSAIIIIKDTLTEEEYNSIIELIEEKKIKYYKYK